MNELLNTVPRPLRWGFFVVGGVVLLLTGIRFGWSTYLSGNWSEVVLNRQVNLAETVQAVFQEKVRSLLAVARQVADNERLLDDMTSNVPEYVIRGQRGLRTYQGHEGMSVDVIDSKGTLLSWQGREMVDNFQPFITRNGGDTTVAITQGELRSFLSAGVHSTQYHLTVVVSEPFELNVPISNRFISRKSFVQDLSTAIGREVSVAYGSNDDTPSDGRSLRIELEGLNEPVRAAAIVLLPTLAGELQSFQTWIDALTGMGIIVLVSCLAVVAYGRFAGTIPKAGRVAFVIIVVWGIRYLGLSLGFPALLIGGWLFDPSVYASPFGAGLASSLGETLISVIALLITLGFVWHVLFREESKLEKVGIVHFLSMPLACFLLLLVLRAYGATLRSFVYDSTLQFVDVEEVFPEPAVAVMYGVTILLTVALIFVFTISVSWMMRVLKTRFPGMGRFSLPFGLTVLYAACMLVFFALNRTPQFPDYTPLILFFSSIGIVVWSGSDGKRKRTLNSLSGVCILIALSFLISVPVLDQKVHSKERDRVRVFADELVRPVDAWLSFVVGESFRSLSQHYEEVAERITGRNGPIVQIAFPVWSKTLVSREGYNSALFLYDTQGIEQSRFSVGLTSYEQTQLLKRLFDTGEETLNVVERRIPQGMIKYYGMWGTLRNEAGQPEAIAAILLSASERALFRGEAPELLRTLSSGSADLGRRVTVSEYQNGNLVASNDEELYVGMPLPRHVGEYFREHPGRYYEFVDSRGGREYESLIVRDDAQSERHVEVALEDVGVRWHLFNVVKVALVYLGAMFLSILLYIVAAWGRYRAMLFGFRGKLIAAFLVVAIVPLMVFGYYNREFAAERQSVSLSRSLGTDLDLIRQRIITSVSGEEDFLRGINSDFCETVASEYGIDFTVFRWNEMLASSKPELFQSGILDSRLPGNVFAEIVVGRKSFVQTNETIGDVAYAVGYQPIVLDGRTLGILSVPTLYRQQEIEAELAERNAFTFGVYSILLVVTIGIGVVLASQLSQPIRDLTEAAEAVGEGRLDVRLKPRGSGELAELVGTFNEMVGELKKSREELSRVEREKAWKEMAKQVAHEIKNPLTPMKLSVQHLRQAFKDNAKDLGAIITRVTQTITEQIDTLARIATEFSHFARMPERKFERVDIHQLLNETIYLFGEVKKIEFRRKFSDHEAVLVADRDELRRVFVNLVRNSIQAMEGGGTITVETEVLDHRCVVRFRDTGAGIPEELLSKVFQPSFSTKTDGMGLGLAIVRKVIEDLNGTIELSSKVGEGTTVTMKLPLQVFAHGA